MTEEKLPAIINRAIEARAIVEKMKVGKRRSADSFKGAITRLNNFTRSYPMGHPESVKLFFTSRLVADFYEVVPGSALGNVIIARLTLLHDQSK